MNYQINTHAVSTTQNVKVIPSYHGARSTKSAPASLKQKTAAWESPTIEAFDLCMEVTAYFQQGK